MGTGSRILFATCAASLLAGCSPGPAERMARAREALAGHRYSQARPDLQAVLQEQPRNRAARIGLARIHVAQQDPDAAIALLDRMATQGGLPPEAQLLRGEALLMLGRFDDALAGVAGLDSAEAWRIRAIARIGQGDFAESALAFGRGRRAPGNRSRLLADHAHFSMEHDGLEEARVLARLAVRADGRELSALMVNGDIAMAAGQHRGALAWYSRAARFHPEDRPALFGRLAALSELKRFGELRRIIAAAREAAPNDMELLYLDARLEADRKDWKAARALLQPYETSLETMPDSNALYAEALLRLGQTEQARTRLSSQLLREPENRKVRVLLGEAKLAVDDAEGALETLEPISGWSDASARELDMLARAQARAAGG